MICPNCKEEIRQGHCDDTPGAVYVSLDSGNHNPYAWPAMRGIKKYKGCVQFGRGCDDVCMDMADDSDCMCMYPKGCDEVYYDHPKAGEAWLVKPKGQDWERVDDQIEFSE